MLASAINQAFDANLLRDLQSRQHSELLDIIDNLRAQGLNDHVDLPQLIVCGDQSSGKSSVLAAISGVPFPKRDNLCTRFATEVILRRHDELDTVRISASIVTGDLKHQGHHLSNRSFNHDLESMDQLPDTLEKAAAAMGVGNNGSAFSSSILRLEVRGPQMPQLTIVDLPGFIHAENRYQSAEDIGLVTELVEHYMSQERSIILAVVSAKNDYANQIVLTKARRVDPDGRRTLGIITKPDTLSSGSSGESSFLSLAKNRDVRFALGWHVVRNQDSNQASNGDRDQAEASFFETTHWSQLGVSQRGISALRHRLSEVLFQQIAKELPAMIREILDSIEVTEAELIRMGRSRTSDFQKRLFVMELAQKYGSRAHAACEGLYDDPFLAANSGGEKQSRRLRAIIQNANIVFAKKMQELPLGISPHRPAPGARSDSTNQHIVASARHLISSHRGKELPGTFNPLLVGPLFRELSKSWPALAFDHVEKAWLAARTTTLAILKDVADDDVATMFMTVAIEPKLESMRSKLELRLEEYMHEYHQQPMTYDHYLMESVHATRMQRQREKVVSICHEILNRGEHIAKDNVHELVSALIGDHPPTMDDVAAETLADYAQAYYKESSPDMVALKRMVDEIPAHVIEPIIFTQLPAFLDPSEILKMSETDINTIADESDSRKIQRQQLQSKLDVLTRSRLLCKLYLEKDMTSDAQEAASLHTGIKLSCGKTPSSSVGTSGDNEVVSDDSWEKTTTLETSHAGLESSLAPPIEGGLGPSPFSKKERKKGKKAVSKSELITEAWS